MSAPIPLGPANLWAAMLIMSTPSPAKETGMRPGACTASQWTSAPAAVARAAISATGWITPVSLLASMTETSASGPCAASALSSLPKSSRPSPSTGRTMCSSATTSAVRSTAGCSIALTMSTRRPAPLSAVLLASVPPAVKTNSGGLQPINAAICSRASSMRLRTSRPKPWTDDGLPASIMVSLTAVTTSGLIGAVAL